MPQVQANGLTIEYDDHGRQGDPVVILIMGFSGQLIMWPLSFVNALVKRGFRVIRFDNRDVGLSTHLAEKGAADIGAAKVDSAAAAIRKLGLDPRTMTDSNDARGGPLELLATESDGSLDPRF